MMNRICGVVGMLFSSTISTISVAERVEGIASVDILFLNGFVANDNALNLPTLLFTPDLTTMFHRRRIQILNLFLGAAESTKMRFLSQLNIFSGGQCMRSPMKDMKKAIDDDVIRRLLDIDTENETPFPGVEHDDDDSRRSCDGWSSDSKVSRFDVFF